jgi:hypothetical protein
MASRTLRGLILLGAACATGGCVIPGGVGVNLGGTGTRGVTSEDQDYSAGIRSSTTVQVARDSGFAFGPEMELLSIVGNDPPRPAGRWRLSALAGYAWLPLPHRPPVGLETLAHFGGGRFPVGTRTRTALAFGPRVGAPIRLGLCPWATKPIWDAEAMVAPCTMVVPSFGATFYVPTEKGVDHSPRTELSLGLAFRFHLWSSLIP